MKREIAELLLHNGRMDVREIALRLNISQDEAAAVIAELEAENIIKGYKAIVDDDFIADNKVKAIIEVKVTPSREAGFDGVARRIARFPEVLELYLVSGSYDLKLEVEADSLQAIAAFVAEKLSTIDGIISTETLFLLKKYKEAGIILEGSELHERLKVAP